MRSNLFLAALAAGAAHAYEKRVYVTDWTTVTVTKTVTAPAVTETVTPVQQVQVANTVLTTSTEAPAIVETKSTSDLAKKSTEAVPVNEPATTQAAQVQQEPATSYFSTAWTSTFEAASSTEQAQAPASTSSTTQAAAASTSSPALLGNLTPEYISNVLHNHNVHRTNHSVTALDWHDNLYTAARILAEQCVYKHNTDINSKTIGKYGQNIGYGVAYGEVGEMITNLMYNDEISYYPGYGTADPDMSQFDKWGHFSQIVWKGTTHVACHTEPCDGLGNVDGSGIIPFTVCNYGPPGNYAGEYGDNVLKPSGEATYTA